MTWTCKCTTVNEDHWKMCNGCGADRPAWLSDMGMEALEAFNAGRRAIHAVEYEPASFRSAEVTRTEAFAFWKAARAPLEAENETLRERVRELESHHAAQLQGGNEEAMSALMELACRKSIEALINGHAEATTGDVLKAMLDDMRRKKREEVIHMGCGKGGKKSGGKRP